jgi:hypothetical protein
MHELRILTAAAVVGSVASAAVGASVAITESAVTTAGGKTVASEITYSIAGKAMRIERRRDGDQQSARLVHIYDAGAGRLIVLDPSANRADVYDAHKAAADVEKKLPSVNIVVDIKPIGTTREILGASCSEYQFTVRAPIPSTEAVAVTSGKACLSAQAPGAEEYAGFFRAADAVLVAGSVDVPKTMLAIDRSETELYRRLALAGGIPYAIEMTVDVEGKGLMASMLRKMAATSRSVTAKAVNTTPIDAQRFVVPAGWKVKNQ